MSERISISKSVARAFRLLELFREQQRPMLAAEICRRLHLPQPSVRALLKNLVSIGYLEYHPGDRTYLPTRRLAALGDWLRPTDVVPPALMAAVDAIVAQAGETASLCTIRDINAEILHVAKARHPAALQLEPGAGVALWRTVVGRMLLAQCDGEQADQLVHAMQRRERSTEARRALQAIPRELKQVREKGWIAGYDLFLMGIGAVSVPAGRDPAGNPLAVTVAGVRDRIRMAEPQLVRLIRAELRRAGA